MSIRSTVIVQSKRRWQYRKDGRWEGRYTAAHDPATGKRITKNVLGKTQAEVKEKLAKAIGESQQLDVTKVGSYTVASRLLAL